MIKHPHYIIRHAGRSGESEANVGRERRVGGGGGVGRHSPPPVDEFFTDARRHSAGRQATNMLTGFGPSLSVKEEVAAGCDADK